MKFTSKQGSLVLNLPESFAHAIEAAIKKACQRVLATFGELFRSPKDSDRPILAWVTFILEQYIDLHLATLAHELSLRHELATKLVPLVEATDLNADNLSTLFLAFETEKGHSCMESILAWLSDRQMWNEVSQYCKLSVSKQNSFHQFLNTLIKQPKCPLSVCAAVYKLQKQTASADCVLSTIRTMSFRLAQLGHLTTAAQFLYKSTENTGISQYALLSHLTLIYLEGKCYAKVKSLCEQSLGSLYQSGSLPTPETLFFTLGLGLAYLGLGNWKSALVYLADSTVFIPYRIKFPYKLHIVSAVSLDIGYWDLASISLQGLCSILTDEKEKLELRLLHHVARYLKGFSEDAISAFRTLADKNSDNLYTLVALAAFDDFCTNAFVDKIRTLALQSHDSGLIACVVALYLSRQQPDQALLLQKTLKGKLANQQQTALQLCWAKYLQNSGDFAEELRQLYEVHPGFLNPRLAFATLTRRSLLALLQHKETNDSFNFLLQARRLAIQGGFQGIDFLNLVLGVLALENTRQQSLAEESIWQFFEELNIVECVKAATASKSFDTSYCSRRRLGVGLLAFLADIERPEEEWVIEGLLNEIVQQTALSPVQQLLLVGLRQDLADRWPELWTSLSQVQFNSSTECILVYRTVRRKLLALESAEDLASILRAYFNTHGELGRRNMYSCMIVSAVASISEQQASEALLYCCLARLFGEKRLWRKSGASVDPHNWLSPVTWMLRNLLSQNRISESLQKMKDAPSFVVGLQHAQKVYLSLLT